MECIVPGLEGNIKTTQTFLASRNSQFSGGLEMMTINKSSLDQN